MSGQARAGGAGSPTGGGPGDGARGGLGILGGTFDPIHLGHLAIAEEVRDVLGLARVLFVPAAEPPHKPGIPLAPAEDRARMVELAIAGNEAFALSRVELDRTGPSYAADTVEALGAGGAAAGTAEVRRPTFILSTEALAGLPDWHDPARFLAGCRLAVVPRPGSPSLDERWLRARFPHVPLEAVFLDGPAFAISASEIRRRVAAGRSIRYLVPDAVRLHIADHGLYTTAHRRDPRP